MGDIPIQILFNKNEMLQILGMPDFNLNELNNNQVFNAQLPENLNIRDDDHEVSTDEND